MKQKSKKHTPTFTEITERLTGSSDVTGTVLAQDEQRDNEQVFADSIYKSLENDRENAQKSIPHPDVNPGDGGVDYDDIDVVKFKKKENKPYWNEIETLNSFLDHSPLYIGHLQTTSQDLFFHELSSLAPRSYSTSTLLNIDDEGAQDRVNWWRFPADYSNDITFSRNVRFDDRTVIKVEQIFSKYSGLHDPFLKKILFERIENKALGKDSDRSIIQTIEKNQQTIRTYDKDVSLTVQGCAGSGKTVVLLHRLRYINYNHDDFRNQFVFLTPSLRFNRFIQETLNQFNLPGGCLFSVMSYYQKQSGSEKRLENGEQTLNDSYLSKAYSKAFIQDVYRSQLHTVATRLKNLIVFGKTLSYNFTDKEDEAAIKKEALEKTKEFYDKYIKKDAEEHGALRMEFKENVNEPWEINLEYMNIGRLEKKISEYIDSQTSEKVTNAKKQLDDEKIKAAKGLDHASIDFLQRKYDETVKEASEIQKRLIEKYQLEEMHAIQKTAEKELREFAIKASLKKLISCVNVFENSIDESVDLLIANKALMNTFSDGALFLENIGDYDTKHCGNKLAEKIKKFKWILSKETDGTQNAIEEWLFEECLARLTSSKNNHKHYWYLKLYCQYLAGKDFADISKKYVFIDECQDLSPAEVELICKINRQNSQNPVINAFGDVGQRVNNIGMDDWEQLGEIFEQGQIKHFELNENFRNTNQVTEYCNTNLPSCCDMTKIGRDGDEVTAFNSFDEVSREIPPDAVIIVKDLNGAKSCNAQFPDNEYTILTVKDAKGLEFLEVFVVDQDMTDNEKYIAYTRALSKLTIIHKLQSKNR